MTLNIHIGNLDIEPLDEGDALHLDSTPVRFIVLEISLPKSETLHTPLGPSNHADFGYSRWREFCERVGIKEVFYDEEGSLHGNLPGALWLTPLVAETISGALEVLCGKYPDYKLMDVVTEGSVLDENFHLLHWLDFWVTWSLKNCERPAIYLS